VKTAEATPRRSDLRRLGYVDVQVETLHGALGRLHDAVQKRSPGAWGFCNAFTVNLAAEDPEFRRAVQAMTMFNDGVGVDIGSRILYGASFPENLNGTDLTPLLLNSLPEGTSIFLLGGKQDVVADACEVISSQHPNIRVVGSHHGYFGPGEAKKIVEHVSGSGAQLVLVGMGHPRQEIWAVRHGQFLQAPILCVGALIDRAAGRVPRAPVVVRKLRLEWLFRLLLEPRRLATRYLVGNFVFLYRIWRQSRGMRRGSGRANA
jgi:exopolysaccharide biosynthesis WecB/TagA/CpsF family protein